MFSPGHWAAAFINSTKELGGEAENGLDALMALVPWVKSLPDMVFGRSAAEKLEKSIREAAAAADPGETASSPALEAAVRFISLMARKNVICHIDLVIDEVKKTLDRKNGVVHVSLESALAPGEDEDRIKEKVKKRTGARVVHITGQIKPELIGGYRLRIGDELMDASIRSQLRKLETSLASGRGGS